MKTDGSGYPMDFLRMKSVFAVVMIADTLIWIHLKNIMEVPAVPKKQFCFAKFGNKFDPHLVAVLPHTNNIAG